MWPSITTTPQTTLHYADKKALDEFRSKLRSDKISQRRE